MADTDSSNPYNCCSNNRCLAGLKTRNDLVKRIWQFIEWSLIIIIPILMVSVRHESYLGLFVFYEIVIFITGIKTP